MRMHNTRFIASIATILMAGVLIVVVFIALSDVSNGQDMQMREIQTQAIQQAVRQCYALEGAYPPDLGYLEAHYGLLLNTEDYRFKYEVPAGNFPPIVEVYPHE